MRLAATLSLLPLALLLGACVPETRPGAGGARQFIGSEARPMTAWPQNTRTATRMQAAEFEARVRASAAASAAASAPQGQVLDARAARAAVESQTPEVERPGGRHGPARQTWYFDGRYVTWTWNGALDGTPAPRSSLPLERRAYEWQQQQLCISLDLGLVCTQVVRTPAGALALANARTGALVATLNGARQGDALQLGAEYNRLDRDFERLPPQQQARFEPRSRAVRQISERAVEAWQEEMRIFGFGGRQGWINGCMNRGFSLARCRDEADDMAGAGQR